MNNLIVVTDYETVPEDDFYLADENWIKNNGVDNIKELRELAKDKQLFIAYVIDAKNYAIYRQMDAQEIRIDGDNNQVMTCESTIIENKHRDVWEDDTY